jgi:hypothetical protein
MDTVITGLQVLFGFLFTVGGSFKLLLPYARYTEMPTTGWSSEFKPEHIRMLGCLELAAAVGLIIPLFLDSVEMLTPAAAVGIALYMAGAMATHLRRTEYGTMVGNLVWLSLALLVAYDRLVEFIS